MPSTLLMESLQGVRRKVRALGVLHGIGLTLASVVALGLSAIVLDYLLNLPPYPRLLVVLAAAALLVIVLWRTLGHALLSKLTLRDVAGKLEHAFPEFDDRLRSTVDFAGADVPGSDVMKRRTIAEAGAIASRIDLSKAIAYKPVVEALGVAALAWAFVVLLGLFMPTHSRIAVSRLLSPFEPNPWPKRVQIDLAGNVPARVPVGQRIDVKVKLVKGDSSSRRAVVYSQYGDGPVQQELMTRGADGTYAASLDARPEAGLNGQLLKVWVRAGDDEKSIAPITVVPRLAIERVEAVVTPPAYAGQTAVTTNLSTSPVLTVGGANVELRVAFNKALAGPDRVRLEPVATFEGKPGPKAQALKPSEWALSNGTLAVGRWPVESSMRFHIRATDSDGFENSALEEYEVIVRPDQTPTVQIEVPRRNEERTAESTVPLQGVTEDDFGIQTAKLVVDRLITPTDAKAGAAAADRPKHWEIPLVEAGRGNGGVQWARADSAPDRLRLRLNYDWQLSQLQDARLQSGDVLEYHLVVQDNYALNGQTHHPVPSGKLRVTILSQEEFANRVADELRLVAQQVGELKKAQARTKQETSTFKDDTKDKKQLDAGDQAVADRLVNQQSTVASQSRQIAGRMDEIKSRLDENKSPNRELRQTAQDVKDILNRAAENPMKDALARLSQSRNPQGAQGERNQNLDQAQSSQQQSSEELQKAIDRMGSVGNLQQTMDRVKDLLAKQQEVSKQTQEVAKNNLGKKPEEMSAEDREKLEKNAREQQNLSEQTQKALSDMEKMAEQLKKSDEASSSAMKQAASTGQQQQVPQKQQKAAQSARQNQQASAQSNQKQAELGLEMILNDLREAERRKLEELARKLEELQQQLAHLIKRQATHNLDDLALQGGDRLNKLDPKVLADLTMRADRARDAAPSALPQLTAGQEQTERNSRDIARTTEELPNGAGPAALLTSAASKMERAIVFLRDQKLDPAYDPWQADALDALVNAKKIVDEQKRKADEKREQQQKDAIRVAYEKIKADQVVLNTETARLNAAPKNPDGALNRVDAVRLGQLPGEQGKIADRTKALDEDLSALGSIVYTWANKDIVASMVEVKGDLAKPDTGRTTQLREARVVAQLDAMIKNLAVKPLDKKFEQRDSGGGGGGGDGAPPLPPEAELRLLRALQDSVNSGTKELAGQPEKDKAAIAQLGNRQGELRNLLDQVFQKSSRGQVKLGPEPDNRDQLPEEAKKEDVENQELDQQLLGENPTADEQQKEVGLIGDRMARSRQRLAINADPGAVTQEIQRRITIDLDALVEAARKQQSQGEGGGKPQQQQVAQQQPKPQQGRQNQPANQNAQAQPQPGQSPAQSSNVPGAADNTADLSQDIKERMTEWGGVTKRQRDAIIEGAGETVIQKYQKLIDDYSRALATKATEQRQ
jgi:hypothetical protein